MNKLIFAISSTALLATQVLAAPPTYHVFATREGLVGGTTANGHVITSNDHFVALPSGTVLNSKGGTTYTVTIRNPANGRVASNVPIWDIGPWNIHDNYWHSPRAEFTSLARGLPEAQAAYQNGFNGGRDDSGRTVANPAGIDLADGTFYDLGSPSWVDVIYNWEDVAVPPREDVFARGTGNTLYHRAWTSSGWTAWQDLGGALTSDPEALSRHDNQINVYVRSTDNAIWTKGWDGSAWSGWSSLGGASLGGAAACSWGTDREDVFIRGTGNTLWHRAWSPGGWSAWQDLGGALTSDPAAISRAANKIDVYTRGNDGALWTKYWDGSAWSGWVSLGGSIVGGAGACSMSSGRLDVFARSTSNTLLHKYWVSGTGWSGFQDLGGTLASDPTAVSRDSSHISVYARGGDGAVWQNAWNGTAWSGWNSLGGSITGGPSACSWSHTLP
jgi:hypothetical protein